MYPDDLDQTSSNAGFPCWNLDFAIYIICSNNISFYIFKRGMGSYEILNLKKKKEERHPYKMEL